jgi:hypothetical protein
MKNIFKNAVEISKKISELKLNGGDIAVDCTIGNGNDTAFLCSLVREKLSFTNQINIPPELICIERVFS